MFKDNECGWTYPSIVVREINMQKTNMRKTYPMTKLKDHTRRSINLAQKQYESALGK
jgi:hypothetical protein